MLSSNNFNILTSVIVLPVSSTYLMQEAVNVHILHVINKLSKQALNLILDSTVFFIYSLETSFHLHAWVHKEYLHVS